MPSQVEGFLYHRISSSLSSGTFNQFSFLLYLINHIQMKNILLTSLIFSFINFQSCEILTTEDRTENNMIDKIIVGTFALERFDESNKRFTESVQVSKGTWDTYDEGDDFEFNGFTWKIRMKVST